MLLPHLLLTGGKNGVLYVLDPDRMGHYQTGGNKHALQTLTLGRGIYAAPAFWNGHVYLLASNDFLADFALDHGRFPDRPTATGTHRFGNPGATPTVSADGNKNGIVWLLETEEWNEFEGRPAVLHAYDATDISRELFSSADKPGNGAGSAVRFTIPSVDGGNVYAGTKGEVAVYGLTSAR